MAIKPPLVLGNDGLPQNLQSGDSISAPTNTPSIRAVTNGETSASIVFGMPVYASASDTVKRAQGNSKATGAVVGLVSDATIAAAANGNIAESGVLVASSTALWDAVVTGGAGGLTFNALYFLDTANVGKITTTVPSGTGGVVNTLIGRALSTTELELVLNQPILL